MFKGKQVVLITNLTDQGVMSDVNILQIDAKDKNFNFCSWYEESKILPKSVWILSKQNVES